MVVGSGPNGLAAAVTLARAGLSVEVLEAEAAIGGGARTDELELVEGVALEHDVCSAVHPLAAASEFFRGFDLAAHGVELRYPEASFAQPLDGGRAAVAYRDLERTVEGLGADGPAWRGLVGRLSAQAQTVLALALGDHRSVPAEARRHPLTAAFLGLAIAEQGGSLWNARFRTDAAPALLTGVASHAITGLPSFAGAGTALMLSALAHAPWGWPLPVGGSRAISAALAAELLALGGVVRTGVRVRSEADLPPARATVFDTSAFALLSIYSGRLEAADAGSRARRWARGVRRLGLGNAAAKVDFVLSGPVPWAAPEVRLAGTVHLGGDRAQMVQAEAEVAAGRHAERPVVLVSDPVVVDPGRQRSGLRPLWSYTHVPRGSTVDPTAAVTAQIERFAPGFRELVVAARAIPAAQMPEHNANYLAGDIGAGRVTMARMLARPTPAWDPYAGPFPGTWLCSASAVPGPGVHGMGGLHAARRVLRALGAPERPGPER